MTAQLVRSHLLTFRDFLELPEGEPDAELVDGVVVKRMAVQLEHEKLFAWLLTLLYLVTEEHHLGMVLGSRTPVQITVDRGRLPDLLFVRQERLDIVQQKAIFGAPDLVIELVSPSGCAGELAAREADYRAIGVPEIVFIHQHKASVRVLRKRAGASHYTDATHTQGDILLESLGGLPLALTGLFVEPRPAVRNVLAGWTPTPSVQS